MPMINTEDLVDGCSQAGKLTAKLRQEGVDGKMLLYKIMYLANILVQASGTPTAQNKLDFAAATTWLATESNLDIILKDY